MELQSFVVKSYFQRIRTLIIHSSMDHLQPQPPPLYFGLIAAMSDVETSSNRPASTL
ncbi:hypothetical protein MTR_1g044670 [Medicago truncatula]|nr:hypothetical protein MTR_1g044670 [Medicago truncatula]